MSGRAKTTLWLAAILATMVTSLAGASLLQSGILRLNYPNRIEYPVRGLDISHHQGEILWQELPRPLVQFLFIKASEGGDFRDPAFDTNRQAASDRDIPWGAYHFFTFCRDGAEQAENFLTVPGFHAADLPPVIDVELGGNCKSWQSVADVRRDLRAMITRVAEGSGRRPMLYVTREAYDHILSPDLRRHDLWVRDVFRPPRWADAEGWLFWQYGNRGRIDGISGHVDLNVFRGSRDEFLKLIAASPPARKKADPKVRLSSWRAGDRPAPAR
ncbi:MAG: GH25 family lysozyme [Acidobacteriota bacterium]